MSQANPYSDLNRKSIERRLEHHGLTMPDCLDNILNGVGTPDDAHALQQWRSQLDPQPIFLYHIDDLDEVIKILWLMIDRLYKNIWVVGNASRYEETETDLLLLQPDILIVDLILPGMGGFEIIQHYRQHLPESVYTLRAYRHRDLALVIPIREMDNVLLRDYNILTPDIFDQLIDDLITLLQTHRASHPDA